MSQEKKKTNLGRQRTRNFGIRIRRYDEAVLDAKKSEANMTRSGYIRNLILTASPYQRPRYTTELTDELYQELNRIGNVLNDIAHTTNKHRRFYPCDLKTMVAEFASLLALYDEHIRDKTLEPY